MEKNKNILVVSESRELYSTKRLLQESKRLKYTTNWLNPFAHLLQIGDGSGVASEEQTKHNGLCFLRTTGTRYDEFDLCVARHYESLGYKIANSLKALDIFRKKDNQALFFNAHNIPCVKSILYRGELKAKDWEIIKKLSNHEEKYILKMIRGNQGIGVNLITGSQSLLSLLETFHALKDQKFLIQPFIPHKKEWRVFVIKDEILGIIERTITPDNFRGNSRHSKGKMITTISTDLKKEIDRAMHLSQLDYCGIDIMETKEGFTFLEMNPVAGFQQMEELSGKNIARELISRLV
jgi:ribosomal protein S6--L-glutamate ligase